MWRWRDWVIDAFNRNLPFDHFARDQIAGDMLPNATLEQKMATGFNRNHRANTEDGIIPEEYAVEYVVDRVETNSAVFLGLTTGCARCHNHKYDPFTQKEFYQMFAYFNNVPEQGRAMKYGNSEPLISAPTKPQQAALDAIDQKVCVTEDSLRKQEASIARDQQQWEQRLAAPLSLDAHARSGCRGFLRPHQSRGCVRRAVIRQSRGGRQIRYRESLFAVGLDLFRRNSRWQRDVPHGRQPQGQGLRRPLGPRQGPRQLHQQLGRRRHSDGDRTRAGAEGVASHRGDVLRFAHGRRSPHLRRRASGKNQGAARYALSPLPQCGQSVHRTLPHRHGMGAERRFRGRIDEVRVYARVLDDRDLAVLALGESVNDIARKPDSPRSTPEKFEMRSAYLATAAPVEIRKLAERLDALLDERAKLVTSFPTVMVMAEANPPKSTFLLVRGAYDHPGGKVAPGVPSVLPPLPAGAPNNRLGFAEWVIDPKNPLLARVTVNRFWQMYFGMGIVKTVEDFGSQGEWPSNPELLDWLATEFVRSGWDVKALQKSIVMSAAYRQSSEATPDLLQRDPENRLLARGPRFRLPAEMIRDQALSAAGLLVEKIGGPSVKPYQPEGLWKEISMQDMDYVQGHGDDLYRRSLYTFWKRTIAPPEMINFDSANRKACVVRETRTNTPLQALNLMNDVTYVEAARFVGQRIMKEGGASAEDRLRYGFRLVTGHWPSKAQQDVLLENLRFHRDYFSDAANVDAYLAQGESQPDTKLDRRELAAYASLASLLLNLDEAMTKE